MMTNPLDVHGVSAFAEWKYIFEIICLLYLRSVSLAR